MATAAELQAAAAAGFEAFVEAWHGPPVRPVVVADGSEPEALRRWWALAAAHDRPLAVQNRLLAPDECWEVDGLTVFYDEDQSVQQWAHEASGDDPQVWEQIDDGTGQWVAVGLALSDFLLAVAVLEASFGPHALVLLEAEQADRDAIVAGLVELPITVWPGATFLVGDDVLVNLLVDQPPDDPITAATTWTVLAAAPTPDLLDALASRSPSGWDLDSRDDA